MKKYEAIYFHRDQPNFTNLTIEANSLKEATAQANRLLPKWCMYVKVRKYK